MTTITNTSMTTAINMPMKAMTIVFPETIHYEEETHLTISSNLHCGDNAEAYFSFNDEMIVFSQQVPAWSLDCDQIFYTRLTKPMRAKKFRS